MSLYMIRMELPLRELFGWARHNNLGINDTGYLAHLALRAAFGMDAPQPFAITRELQQSRALEILGYATKPSAVLLEYHEAVTDPLLHAAVPPERISEKRMPDGWTEGRRFGFRVLCCPVKRYRDDDGKTREHDAFLSECVRCPGEPVERDQVYRDWLAGQLGRDCAAVVHDCAVEGFKLVKPVRRSSNGSSRRRIRGLPGLRPEVMARGVLEVAGTEAFGRLIARGVGRHRAFGYGMLLLSAEKPKL